MKHKKKLLEKGKVSACIHFNHLYPLDKEKIESLFDKKKRYILVENNSWGQLGKLLAVEAGVVIDEKILRYDGRPITVEYIINNFKI